MLSLIVSNQFEKINIQPDWEGIVQLMRSNICSKQSVPAKWLKPSISFVKVNSDESCKEGECGAGGAIRDHLGHLILAYSLFGVEWCVMNGYDMILEESDSKLLVDCANDLGYATMETTK